MKIAIYTKNYEPNKLLEVLEPYRHYFKAMREDYELEVKRFDWAGESPYFYRTYSNGVTRKLINGHWLEAIRPNCDVFFYHDPEFKVDGANGAYMINHKTKGAIAWGAKPLNWQDNRYEEFAYDIVRLIIHEIAHVKYDWNEMPDNTHYWQSKDNLMGALMELQEARENSLRGLLLRLRGKLLKLVEIRSNEQIEVTKEPLYIVHHSGTTGRRTRKETILRMLDGSKKGFDWYHKIIMPDGEVIENRTEPHDRGSFDYCLVGNFTEEEPTEEQIKVTKELLKGKNWITHKEAGERGIATKSECPGNLKRSLTN